MFLLSLKGVFPHAAFCQSESATHPLCDCVCARLVFLLVMIIII